MQLPPPARIWIADPAGEASIVDANDSQRAVEAESNGFDNKKKLAPSKGPYRRLLVYVEPVNFGPWQALASRGIPHRPPALLEQVTHAWVAAEGPGEFIVRSAEPPNGGTTTA